MKCPNCGFDLNGNIRVCPNCGVILPVVFRDGGDPRSGSAPAPGRAFERSEPVFDKNGRAAYPRYDEYGSQPCFDPYIHQPPARMSPTYRQMHESEYDLGHRDGYREGKEESGKKYLTEIIAILLGFSIFLELLLVIQAFLA